MPPKQAPVSKQVPGQPVPKLVAGLPVTTGSVLATIHAELTEMVREINQNRLTLQAVDKLCEETPGLRDKITTQMRAIAGEAKAKRATR